MRLTEQNIIKKRAFEFHDVEYQIKAGFVYDSGCIMPDTILRCRFVDNIFAFQANTHINIIIERSHLSDKMKKLFSMFKECGAIITPEYIVNGIVSYKNWVLKASSSSSLDNCVSSEVIDEIERLVKDYISNDCGIDISGIYLCETILFTMDTYKNVYLSNAHRYLKCLDGFCNNM